MAETAEQSKGNSNSQGIEQADLEDYGKFTHFMNSANPEKNINDMSNISGVADDGRQSSGTADDARKASGTANDERESSSSGDTKEQTKRTITPEILKERVMRERDKQVHLMTEIEELKKQMKAIRSGQASSTKEAKEPSEDSGKTEAVQESAPPKDKKVEYWGDEAPDETYYATYEKWVEAMDKWVEGGDVVKPALNLKRKDVDRSKVDKHEVEAKPKVAKTPKPSAADLRRQQFETIGEALDDAPAEASKKITEDFFEMVTSHKIELTQNMLEFMEFEEDVWKLVEVFIDSPRVSRRIARMPSSRQTEALQGIIRDFGKKPKSKENTGKKKADDVPAIDPLRGSSGKERAIDTKFLEDTSNFYQFMNETGAIKQ